MSVFRDHLQFNIIYELIFIYSKCIEYSLGKIIVFIS